MNDDQMPQLGDHVSLPDLVQVLASTLAQTLSTRLTIEAERQAEIGGPTSGVTVSIDFRLLQSICAELSRNASQALCGVPLQDVYNLTPPDEKCGCAECTKPNDESRAFVAQMASGS